MLKLLGLLLLVAYLGLVWHWERKRNRISPWQSTPTERRIRLPRLRDKRKSSSSCDHLP